MRDIFKESKGEKIRTTGAYDYESYFTVEELYQSFRSRLIKEVEVAYQGRHLTAIDDDQQGDL